MNKSKRQDVSGAYGDRDEPLNGLQLTLVTLYAVTIGWVVAIAHFIWLTLSSRLLPMPNRPAKARVLRQNLHHNH